MKERPEDLFDWANKKQNKAPEQADVPLEQAPEKPKFVYASKDDGYDFGSSQGEIHGTFMPRVREQRDNFKVDSIKSSQPVNREKSPEEIQAEDESIDREVELRQIEEDQNKPLTPEEISKFFKENDAA